MAFHLYNANRPISSFEQNEISTRENLIRKINPLNSVFHFQFCRENFNAMKFVIKTV